MSVYWVKTSERGRTWRRSVRKTLTYIIVLLSVACVPSESRVRDDVRERLRADPATASLDLSIEVKNRVVYLSGSTTNREEQGRAVAAAEGVDGVKLVVNDMWLNNVALVDKVKQALAADEKIGKIPIEVDAKGSTVRLMSDQTNSEERARAMEIASAVAGVEQVEDRMR